MLWGLLGLRASFFRMLFSFNIVLFTSSLLDWNLNSTWRFHASSLSLFVEGSCCFSLAWQIELIADHWCQVWVGKAFLRDKACRWSTFFLGKSTQSALWIHCLPHWRHCCFLWLHFVLSGFGQRLSPQEALVVLQSLVKWLIVAFWSCS